MLFRQRRYHSLDHINFKTCKKMLTENRTYQFMGELTIKRSKMLEANKKPKDDKVNWLFLKGGEQQFSFVYKIEDPQEATYGKPFKVFMSFTMDESIEKFVKLHK